MKKIIAVILALVLMLALAAPAFAAGNVTYDGNAQKFIFAPGSEYSPTDLFSDMKGVMPGDNISQLITVKNTAPANKYVKIYLRALGAQEDTDEFLSKLTLTVKQQGASTLFEAPANETAQLTDRVLLGTFASGAEVTLNVTLKVPLDLDEKFNDTIGYLDWEFTVEEFDVPPGPKTGDSTNIWIYVAIMAAVVLIAVAAILIAKKKKHE